MTTQTTDLSLYIDTEFFDGRQPHIKGRRIPVSVIVYTAQENNFTHADLMRNFDLSHAEVAAALLYYDEHHLEIDAEEAAINAEYAHDDD